MIGCAVRVLYALVLTMSVLVSGAVAQTAQFTISGVTTTVPLRSDGAGGWTGSGLSPLPQNIVVGFSSEFDSFHHTTTVSVNVAGQATGPAFPVSVLLTVPLSLPSGPTTVSAQAGGANAGPVGVNLSGQVSANNGASFEPMGVDLNTHVTIGSVTVNPQPGPVSPPFNAIRVTGSFSTQGNGQVLNTSGAFTIGPGGLGSPPPAVARFHANGAGRFTSLLTGSVQFVLSAAQQKSGDVLGTLLYRERDQDFGVRVAIDCLNVVNDRAIVTGTITAVDDPDLDGFVGLPAAFAVRDLGHGPQSTTSDLAADLRIIFADCVDPTVVQLMNPLTPLDGGNVAVTTH